jgi:hypothetical protein
LVALYGLHEKFVNNLVSRFDEGLISDMHAYVDPHRVHCFLSCLNSTIRGRFLRESWAVALFHDRFAGFLADLRRAVRDSPVSCAIECISVVFSSLPAPPQAVDLAAFNAAIAAAAAAEVLSSFERRLLKLTHFSTCRAARILHASRHSHCCRVQA